MATLQELQTRRLTLTGFKQTATMWVTLAGGSRVLINSADFDPAIHKADSPAPVTSDADEAAGDDEAAAADETPAPQPRKRAKK